MADNDYYEEQQLINRINSLRMENAALQAELESALSDLAIIADNLDGMSQTVLRDLTALRDHTGTVDENTAVVERALKELSTQYATFKNLSSATKNVTQATEEYNTRFTYFHKLRRIALGYVIGLDNAIISNETLRKEVEKVYLQNTDYWLAYAISAVMLWANDEKDASLRALKRSISMDPCKTDVFFLLINLRFERFGPAKNWYLDYLEKVDLSALGTEYQYLLQAYLSGLFGYDPEFERLVKDDFRKSVERIDAMTVDFRDKFTERARRYAETYLHRTEQEFPSLKECSPDYEKLITLLSKAECNGLFARQYAELARKEEEISEDPAQRVENVLYDLTNSYDDEEWKVIKRQKENEAIIEAQGDLVAAKEKYKLQYENMDKKRPLDQLMMDWAFSEDPTITNLIIKRFTISLMHEPISRGFQQFAEKVRLAEPREIPIEIDGFRVTCSQDNPNECGMQLAQCYSKNRLKYAFQDKYIKIFSIVCLASILLLIITAFAFSPIALSIGVMGFIVGGFVLWRRYVELGKILDEKRRLGLLKLSHCLDEFETWKQLFQAANESAGEIAEAFSLFNA